MSMGSLAIWVFGTSPEVRTSAGPETSLSPSDGDPGRIGASGPSRVHRAHSPLPFLPWPAAEAGIRPGRGQTGRGLAGVGAKMPPPPPMRPQATTRCPRQGWSPAGLSQGSGAAWTHQALSTEQLQGPRRSAATVEQRTGRTVASPVAHQKRTQCFLLRRSET